VLVCLAANIGAGDTFTKATAANDFFAVRNKADRRPSSGLTSGMGINP
jgi:ferredoxin-NADP reductase